MPRVYLRNFATPDSQDKKDPQIAVFNLSDKSSFCTNIINIAAGKHLYSPLDENGNRSFEVENNLAELEDKIKPHLDSILNGSADLSNHNFRKFISYFAVTLFMRNKVTIRIHHEFREDIKNNSTPKSDGTGVLYEIEGRAHTFSGEHLNQLESLDSNGMQRLFVNSIIKTAKPLADVINNKRWSLLIADGTRFITSDKPLVAYHNTEKRYGIGTRGVHIQLPISPRHLLLFDDLEGEHNKTFLLDGSAANYPNFLTIKQAERFVFSNTELSEEELELVRDARNI